MRTTPLFVGLAALAALAPLAIAHPITVPAALPSSICYIYTNFDDAEATFWIESNGVTDGGEPTAADHVQSFPNEAEDGTSGLQRGTTPGADGILGTADDVLPDSEVDATTWALSCH